MKPPGHINRRGFLRLAGAGAVAPWLPAAPARAAPAGPPPSFVPDLELALTAERAEVPLLPGAPTRVFRYRAEVLKGDPASVQPLPGSYLGPILRVRRGQRIRVHFDNGLDEETIVHWHGLHVPAAMDGHPRYAVGPGGRYVYEFEVTNRAGTYWFHPHPHGKTGRQVYGGLAGLFLVQDDEEQAAGLPSGAYDIPLVIQDRRFTAGNQLQYLGGGMGMMGMMDRMRGFLGERILVNGRPGFTLDVATRAYRLRLLNGSNARIYKLAWSDGTPLTVIGTDGGLLETPVTRAYVTLAPAERIELWADFSGRRPGSELVLQSLPFSGTLPMGGMMGGMGNLANGAPFPVLKLRVTRRARGRPALPARLSGVTPARPDAAVNRARPRRFHLTMQHMAWGINGRSFEMTTVAEDETVRLGTAEVWEFINDGSGGRMGMMAHPIHIHGLQFRVIGRRIAPGLADAWRTLQAGFVDSGWKDTVLVMPGERVRVLLQFQDHTGLFLYHCHNLEHEDLGMMRNYLVRA